MKIIMRIALTLILLSIGFAAGFPVGQSRGFLSGSEWAFVQANIFAREAGLFMPVSYEDGQFRIILKQPKHLYKSAWSLAERHENELALMEQNEAAIAEGLQPMKMHTLAQKQVLSPGPGNGGLR